VCVAGARWAREHILETNPELDLAVYAIWFDMVATDSRRRWPSEVLEDERVTHFWDEEKVIGRWYGRHPDYGDDPELVIWDTYYLYGPGSTWAEDGPTELESWGYTIVESREKLRRDLLRLAAERGGEAAR